jgi:hypothetical protein
VPTSWAKAACWLSAFLALACQPQQGGRQDSESDSTVPPIQSAAQSGSAVGNSKGTVADTVRGKVGALQRPPKPDTNKTESSGGPSTRIPVTASSKGTETTVAELVASDALVGRIVRVAGRCFLDTPALAPGAPPRTRSDWQLAMNGQALFVTGPRPDQCGENSPEHTITARVAEDTIRAVGRAIPRRYLVRITP